MLIRSWYSRRLLLAVVGALALALPGATARAQSGVWAAAMASHPPWSARACLDSLPATALRRSGVYVEVIPTDSVIIPEYVAAGDSLAQEIAMSMRRALSADTTKLPPGEPVMTWRALAASLELTLHRDGAIHVMHWVAVPDADGPAVALLERALHAAVDTMHAFPALPARIPDSAHARLRFVAPTYDRYGRAQREVAHAPFPVMMLAMPWTEDLRETSRPDVHYPPEFIREFAAAAVTLRFDVDEHGRLDTASVAPSEPASTRKSWSAAQRNAYESFLSAAKRGLAGATFEPARIGGCPVPRTTRQAFQFSVHQ